MSARNALNKNLIMRRVAQAQTTLSTPTTDSDVKGRFPLESALQASMLSDTFPHLETRSNHLQLTATQTPGARTAALSSIDKEIDTARRLTLSLLTRRNALVPISVLPPELLARIFHFHALAVPPKTGWQMLGWIEGATHVCRHWRQIALDDSTLWARISGFSPDSEWTCEMLVRARNAPLAIEFIGMPSAKTLGLFASHVSHTRELRLCDLNLQESHRVREICALEAPALEHFELVLSVVSPIEYHAVMGTAFFKGQAPKLRTFILDQVRFPWSRIPCGQLTQLRITLSEERPTAGISSRDDFNQLVDLLSNCPELEILVLKSCLPSILSQISHEKMIHLPRLSNLSLVGLNSCVTNLFKMLKLPPSATLSLRCTSENLAKYDDRLILPLVSAHFHGPAPVEFKHLTVTLSALAGMLNMTAFTSLPRSKICPSHGPEVITDTNAELSLSFEGLSESLRMDILGRICRMLPISNIEFLAISDCDEVISGNWCELFQGCKEVTTIHAMGRGTSGLLRALAPPKPTNTFGGKGKKRKRYNNKDKATAGGPMPTFPKLTTLLLRNLDFEDVVPNSPPLHQALATTIRQRKRAWTPLKSLSIDSCIITTQMADTFKKIVQEFRWDGDEGVDFDEYNDNEFESYPDVDDPGGRWQDFFVGSTQAEWDWWENYSDGW